MFLKKLNLIILLIILIIGYPALLFYLYYVGLLKPEHLLNNLTMFIGWLVIIWTVFYQVQRNKEAEKAIKNEEIKKLLEKEAFKEINKSITNLSSFLIKVGGEYSSFPINIIFRLNIITEHEKNISELYKVLIDFYLSIDAHEIEVYEFKESYNFIKTETNDLIALIRKFSKYLKDDKAVLEAFAKIRSVEARRTSNIVDAFEKMEAIKEIRNRTNKINQASLDISCYLGDFRIDLMNRFLEEIFDRKVQSRQPGDPSVKILSEIIKDKKNVNPVN